MAVVDEKMFLDGDKIVHRKTHDYNHMLKRAERMRDHGGKFGESQMIGTIDMDLLAQLMKERGISWDDHEAKKELVMLILNSRDFSKLRVYQGRI